MKKQIAFLKLRINLAVSGLLVLSNSLTSQVTHEVSVTNNVFTPSEITIAVGDEVKWINSQGNHNVNGSTDIFPDNPESFGNAVGSGWTYSHTFTIPGEYDYQCDPHTGFNMFGVVIVEPEQFSLTINFSGMFPHKDQDLWLRVEDTNSSEEIFREKFVVEESFSVEVPGVDNGRSYVIEFYSDHNRNGRYDPPGEDHAWRLIVDEVTENKVIDFVHNTEFTDIEWVHKAIINLDGMDPHLDQEIYFALIETASGEIIDRKSEIVSEKFTVELAELVSGKDYRLDFFADHNRNGYYDSPNTDHAWRIDISDANGDTIIDFMHSTSFVDIQWKHRLRIEFFGMGPHTGEPLKLFIRDATTFETMDSVLLDEITSADFRIEYFGIVPGSSYNIDFYVDHNGNDQYDTPPTDHAWRIGLSDVGGDEEIEFTHNTEFQDIEATLKVKETIAPSGLRLMVYPNPGRDRITFIAGDEISAVTILSITGEIIEKLYFNSVDTGDLSVNELPTGIYLLEFVTAGSGKKTVRFMKE